MDNKPIISFQHLFEFPECFSKNLLLRMEKGLNFTSDNLSDYSPLDSSKTTFSPARNADSQSNNSIANFQSQDTLQSLVQSCFCANQPDKSIGSHIPDCKQALSQPEKSKSESESLACLSSRQSSKGNTTISSANVMSDKAQRKNKPRIRWTKDLHNKFIECVNRLGGIKQATPKRILKLMNCEGLTIFHVKSHLQKSRATELMQGKAEQIDTKTNLHIVEALKLQIAVQRRLCEQLESQKKLQARIEEQAKQLQTMMQSQLKSSN